MLATTLRLIFLTGFVLILFGVCLEMNTILLAGGLLLLAPSYFVAHYAANHYRKAATK